MTVKIVYYAALREQRGLAEDAVETSAATVDALYAELKAAHGFTLPSALLRAAVNDQFVPWDAPLRAGDTVVFIPPVAGG